MNRRTFESYIQEYCEDLAKKNNNYSHRQKHACVITYNNAIIANGININLKNDFIDIYNPLKCLHAEAVTIMRALQRHHRILYKSELWVCRIDRHENFNMLSKPCPMCMRIIKTFKIPTIHYTDNNGDWITENF